MKRTMIAVGGVAGLIAIVLGAFGSHALKEVLSQEVLISFKTGIRYQMYHALFLICIAALADQFSAKNLRWIFYLVLTGMVFFSGSIYLLCVGPVWGMDFGFLGPVTPLGGICLMAAWVLTILAALKSKV